MSNEIIRIGNIASRNKQIDTVMYALNKENLKQSAKKIAGNKAVGIDKVTKKEYMKNLDNNIEDLIARMKRMAYKPKAVRRVYIPKAGSDKKRPLGIPAFEDKIVQDQMSQILNVIYEPMFKNFSFGFRPNRSCHQAIAYLDKMIHREKVNYIVDLDIHQAIAYLDKMIHREKVNYIVDLDIKGFFDNIDHKWLIKFIEYRIRDKVYIRYIRRFLKSGILEQGKQIFNKKKQINKNKKTS